MLTQDQIESFGTSSSAPAERTIFDVAVDLGAERDLLTSVPEALSFIATANPYFIKNDVDWSIFRKVLREHLLAEKILFPGSDVSPFVEFDGYGDSGTVEDYYPAPSVPNKDTYLPIVVTFFLHQMINKYVTFDWYNNDGGGGDATWDVTNDKVIINGYQNVTERHDMMSEQEF